MEHLNHNIGMGTATVEFIAQRLAGGQSGDLRESLKSDLLREIVETGRDSKVVLRPIKVDCSRRRQLKGMILENLTYGDMRVRETSVVKASDATFRWIFERGKHPDRPWAGFCEWLESPDKQIYWITGKPGSGKSTLMKYISQPASHGPTNDLGKPGTEPRCTAFLRKWAGTHPLIVASYYFWAVGSPIQRSKEGMLRTLLHELLSQLDPEVITTIMLESSEALHLFDEDPWTCTESSLQDRLSRAIGYMCRSMKICLFIDGLDEFEGPHEDLIEYLGDTLRTHPIKLCVSSRQWQIFEDKFDKEPSLRMQELTLPDMVKYVRSELYDEPAFALLQNLDPSFSSNLDESIALRADGVFLWLNLVVKSLRKGIRAGDRISDLQMRLSQLPQDLEALFDRILGDIDPEFRDHTIQYFDLMESSLEIGPPNVMVFSYADEENETFGIHCPVSPLDMKTYENKRDQLKRRLNTRCMGLLEITEQPKSGKGMLFDVAQSRVQYLHRTVGDYMARDEVRERLGHRARRGPHQLYDPHLRFCSAELAFHKLIASRIPSPDIASGIPSNTNRNPRTLDPISRLSLINCLRHAAAVKTPGLQSMVRLLDELGNVFLVDDKWVKIPRAQYVFDIYHGEPFIQFVIQCGVVEYLRAKVPERSLIVKLWHKVSAPVRRGTPHSPRATDAWSDFEHLDWQLSHAVVSDSRSPAIVELLLERGADPQYKDPIQKLSTWILALALYIDSRDRESDEK